MKLIDIAFDLDGVLVDILPPIKNIIKEHGAELKKVRGFKLETEPYLNDEIMRKIIFKAYTRIDEIHLYDGVKYFLQYLYNLSDNDPIRIITARSSIAAGTTYKLLEDKNLGIPYEIIFSHDKLPFLNRYTYFVEDRRANAKYLADNGKRVFLVNRDYNEMEEHPNIIKINEVIDLNATLFIKEER